jgi:hypothetical protein
MVVDLHILNDPDYPTRVFLRIAAIKILASRELHLLPVSLDGRSETDRLSVLVFMLLASVTTSDQSHLRHAAHAYCKMLHGFGEEV